VLIGPQAVEQIAYRTLRAPAALRLADRRPEVFPPPRGSWAVGATTHELTAREERAGGRGARVSRPNAQRSAGMTSS
jgi:hypothetical protein